MKSRKSAKKKALRRERRRPRLGPLREVRASEETSPHSPELQVGSALEDETMSTSPEPMFPIVCVGASAGGIEAFSQLLHPLPKQTGMAFILIQHLSPERESAL